MVIIGIDVGLTGAIGAVGGPQGPEVYDLPTVPDGNGRRIDGRELILRIRGLVPADGSAIAVIEDVRPRPNPARGTSIVTEGSLMRSRGLIEAALDIARIPIKPVQPQAWKRSMSLLKAEKGASLELARRLFPSAADELKRKKDHNRAEALLIARYGQMRFT